MRDLIRRLLAAAGVYCPLCGAYLYTGETCPFCGTKV